MSEFSTCGMAPSDPGSHCNGSEIGICGDLQHRQKKAICQVGLCSPSATAECMEHSRRNPLIANEPFFDTRIRAIVNVELHQAFGQ